MSYILPELPYAYEALEPTVSANTLHFHHDKHHAAYVTALNGLLNGDDKGSLEEVIKTAAPGKVFNNAAQAWNHAFFWDAMSPEKTAPGAELAAAINEAFGDLAALKTAFVTEAVGHFASGWVWLVAEGGKLKVISTHDAATTVTEAGVTPLLVCDVWEHAYYLDHQNNRKGFLEAWFDTLANWTLADSQFAASKGAGEVWAYPAPQ
ncbi:MAG TPA: superoxide dismutase [Caulobacter sp.]|nr:MAG: superoxide dismutase [Fe] [Caulobacter sp. 39-67-4]HQR88122.1 superoxide dismutase [Caulobacter sp.]